MVCTRSAKTASAATTASTHGTPDPIATAASAAHPMKTPIAPRRGRYWRRARPYAAIEPMTRASTVLVVAMTTVLRYGRKVSSRRSTKMYRQFSRVGLKSANGR